MDQPRLDVGQGKCVGKKIVFVILHCLRNG